MQDSGISNGHAGDITMVSRLDRLFILLDTGSNESIRLAAAKQLGEVQKVQPNDLNYLLRRIKEYSNKSVWETRVAAGHATRHVLEQVESWPSASHIESNDNKKHVDNQLKAAELLKRGANIEQIFQDFDLETIISLCPKLLSMDILDSEEQQEAPTSSQVSKGRGRARGGSSRGRRSNNEQLMRQRQLINKELGISIVDSLNLDVKSIDIVSNDDLQTEYNSGSLSPSMRSSSQQQDARTALKERISNYEKVVKILSDANCVTNNVTDKSQSDEEQYQTSNDRSTNNRWPLTDITRDYVDDLFDSSWEVRHGAGIALREIVRLQGRSAGRWLELSKDINDKLNQLWLIDMAFKTICVLALDKFGDFLFDQVVAPVRENAAQVLGCCVSLMDNEAALATLQIMVKMLDSPNWETRHGGILGLKYSLIVLPKDLISKALKSLSFNSIFKCLADPNDDVAAEAASCLVPVKDLMIEIVPNQCPKLIKFLWDHLAVLDELTTSTSNIVLLLASLITSSSAELNPNELIKSIPKLWPLLSHPSTTVRVSAYKAVITLIKPQKTSCLSWMPESLLSDALRLVFQGAILENVDELRQHIEELWMQLIRIDNTGNDRAVAQAERLQLLRIVSMYLNYWPCLIMQPHNLPIDRSSPQWLNLSPDSVSDTKVYIAGCTFNAETFDSQKAQITRCRLLGSRLVGALYANLVVDAHESQQSSETLKYLSDMFAHYLKTKSANQRMFSGWILESWACFQSQLGDDRTPKFNKFLPDNLTNQLRASLQETSLLYDELSAIFTRLQQEARDFVAALVAASISTNFSSDRRTIYNLNQIQAMCELNIETELTRLTSKRTDAAVAATNDYNRGGATHSMLCAKKTNLAKTLASSRTSLKSLSISALSSLACAQVAWRLVKDKLKLSTEPLLDSIESDEEPLLQDRSSSYLVSFLDMLCANHEQYEDVINGILRRLMTTLYEKSALLITELDDTILSDESNQPNYKIIQLNNLQKKAEHGRRLARRQSLIGSTSGLKRAHSVTFAEVEKDLSIDEQNRARELNELKVRGVSLALGKITNHFGLDLPQKLPLLWACLTTSIRRGIKAYEQQPSVTADPNLVINLNLLQVVVECLDDGLRGHLFELFSDLIRLLPSPDAMIRHQSAQCIGSISRIMFDQLSQLVSEQIVPMMDRDENLPARCGAVEAVALIIENLDQQNLISRINMFIVHVLRRMSDQNEQVRLMATHCFGKLLSLIPLNMERTSSNGERQSELPDKRLDRDVSFIEQLLDPKKLDDYRIPFEMEAELRSYQQDGVNWLAFLNRFNLHGILCDEMGLGKTLMTICIVASDHFMRESDPDLKRLSSLIVCPSTLTEHWLYEIIKFVPLRTRSILNPVAYSGSQATRAALRDSIKSALSDGKDQSNIIVTSFDVLRNDIDFFRSVQWNYCVLDEGHIIKNGKTKLSRAIRMVTARHRLILSGTPIQNNVTELWSLFDFLMPGFLGSERLFNSRYTKPILQSREPKCSPRELEAGALAMESLHRQVLPFILRRLKEDVLDDLPPKIIQDYYCELSAVQMKLYEDFTRSNLCKEVTRRSVCQLNSNQDPEAKSKSRSHVFQALQYLKNVCNHPKLVLSEKHSQYHEIKRHLAKEKSSLDEISHSSKLRALKQLLIDCGIGAANQSLGEDTTTTTAPTATSTQQQQPQELESVVNQHRALIFCQLRSMVDIIENDLIRRHLPSITYLKLDGSVPTNQRQSIVSRFNNDPSIDVLLLTTKIGGLGLNLTGADTVIFVEHDWNPTKDLQAMDRAHRIGQKKVVNVYRLITKGTLEERIMGLQKFKTMVSNTVINQDNAGLGTMNVDQLLDLFDGKATQGDAEPSADGLAARKSAASFADLLPELWDQQQYETEYDLSHFVSSLKN